MGKKLVKLPATEVDMTAAKYKPQRVQGGTTWFHELREVKKDAVCVSRLRCCGAVLVGKTNMHELALGTTGNNANFGLLYHSGTVAIVGPITATVEDAILVSCGSWCSTGSLRLGKYTEWFNDVFSTEISDKCEDILNQLSEKHGCKTLEIVIPELHEMFIAHVVSIGSEALSQLNPDLEDGKLARLTYDSRINLALFQTYSASDYVAAQCLRRRLMHFYVEIFKKVDIIVTPTTAMTAPIISPAALTVGETNLRVSGSLMRFVLAGNLLGFPAISVPVGYDKQGLPIGMQLIGRPWCEASILRLAAAIEETCAGPKKMPVQFYDILKGNLM
uniref:N-acylethanolamine amidohydrolase n=1 Tax=Solanum tuberosum TaxID=4113 RepID=M0ZU13_SOLTU